MVIELENELQFDELINNGVSLVDFNATWCGPCRMLKPIFHEASENLSEVKFIGVDVDKFGSLAGRYGVRAVLHGPASADVSGDNLRCLSAHSATVKSSGG